jgi:hypothetical protein
MCEIGQARASSDRSFLFSNSLLAFGNFLAKSMSLGTFSIFAICTRHTFAYPPSTLSPAISMTLACFGSHTTPPPICASMAPLSTCTRHGIVFVLLPEYLWHVAWTFWSFASSYFLDLLYSSSPFFRYKTSKVPFITLFVFVVTMCSSHFPCSQNSK